MNHINDTTTDRAMSAVVALSRLPKDVQDVLIEAIQKSDTVEEMRAFVKAGLVISQ